MVANSKVPSSTAGTEFLQYPTVWIRLVITCFEHIPFHSALYSCINIATRCFIFVTGTILCANETTWYWFHRFWHVSFFLRTIRPRPNMFELYCLRSMVSTVGKKGNHLSRYFSAAVFLICISGNVGIRIRSYQDLFAGSEYGTLTTRSGFRSGSGDPGATIPFQPSPWIIISVKYIQYVTAIYWFIFRILFDVLRY